MTNRISMGSIQLPEQGTILVDTNFLIDLLAPTIEEYSQNIGGVGIVDLVLACFLKRYSGLYLLTRNHKDFPTRIFHRSHVFPIEHERDVKTYAFYQYKPKVKQVEIEEAPF